MSSHDVTITVSAAAGRAVGREALKAYVQRFSFLFLGIAAIRVWIQCCMYSRYTATDFGMLTIAGTLARVLVIVVLLIALLPHGFGARTERRLDAASVVLMTLAALLYFVQPVFADVPLSLVAVLCGSAGIAWGATVWIRVFMRLQPGEAFLYSFLAIAVSAVVGFVLGVCGHQTAYLLCAALPICSLLASRGAMEVLDGRPAAWLGAHDTAGDTLSRGTVVSMLVGLALINVALGVARGFPDGVSISLSTGYQAIHQGGVVVLALAFIWWTLFRGHRLTMFWLWGTVCAFVVIGTAIITTTGGEEVSFGGALITLGNSFSVAALWYTCYDVARHSSRHPYVVFGVIWIVHLLPRELGRFLVFRAGPLLTDDAVLAVCAGIIMVLLVAGVALLLSRKETPINGIVFQGVGASADAAAPVVEAGESAPATTAAAPEPWEAFAAAYGLSEREAQIVRLMAMGRNRGFISEELHLSENTVKGYVSNLYTKVGVHTKQELLDLMGRQ